MAWGTIRKPTDQDEQRLDAARERFIARHGAAPENLIYGRDGDWIDGWRRPLDRDEIVRYRKLWHAAAHRALRHKWATGIAHGYVGYNAD